MGAENQRAAGALKGRHSQAVHAGRERLCALASALIGGGAAYRLAVAQGPSVLAVGDVGESGARTRRHTITGSVRVPDHVG